MKIMAISIGFYGGRTRTKGEIFEIADEKAFSPFWMEWVEKPIASEPKSVESEPQVAASKPRGNPNFGKRKE